MTRSIPADQLIAYLVLAAILGITGALAIHYRTRLRRSEARNTHLTARVTATESLLRLKDPARIWEVPALQSQLELPAHQRTDDA
ncbi:hypothetical protein [Actinoplanes sp. CA-252034]|uniref:hypothetical protein n=1 Tax=Actinoplanes sp. CA-252034 TaxID=3239906 RepID=UPI003D95E409